MRIFGLLGFPLEHSLSEAYFNDKFEREGIEDTTYQNFDFEHITNFLNWCKDHPELAGFNVTIPHKEAIIEHLDELSEEAERVGAVNCVKVIEDGMIGYNTDVYGFERAVEQFISESTKALILGTGGAAKAASYVFDQMGVEFLYVSRNPDGTDLGYEDLDDAILEDYHLIVNCTPVGMYPYLNDCPPIPYEFLNSKNVLFDLIYNPEKSLFLIKGEEKGTRIQNGLTMLYLQAEMAWKIWNES